ncbi:hypothetical protein Sinac_4002 [Singulisphaera acidiphila DSM 18658]|uniref:Uncharacterized protein n=1 Tax=Singulisphaera acidiphila (strain ATCC BAA-1392 / DSM 18658 / VKM B-2454 / MOB10) TaxID=886293 RepID=L0DH95_SINAD|nr:hypothetical protein Sinac_4002 [Singulisphaera acidiphila DSM 18658]
MTFSCGDFSISPGILGGGVNPSPGIPEKTGLGPTGITATGEHGVESLSPHHDPVIANGKANSENHDRMAPRHCQSS